MALPDTLDAAGYNVSTGGVEIYKSSGGNFYTVIQTDSATVSVLKSTNPGTSAWSIQDSAGAPTTDHDFFAAIADDNGKIHVIGWEAWTTTKILKYSRFNTGDDTWEYIDQTVADLTGMSEPSSAPLGIAHNPNATNEEVRMFACGLPNAFMGTDYDRLDLWTCNDTGAPSFQGPFSVDDDTSDDTENVVRVGPNSDGSGTHVCYITFGATNRVNMKTLDNGTTTPAFSSQVALTPTQNVNSIYSLGRIEAYDASGTGKYVMPMYEGTISAEVYSIYGNEDASKNATSINESSSPITSNQYTSTCGVVQEGGTVYVGIVDVTDKDIDLFSSTDHGATWGSATEAIVATTGRHVTMKIVETGIIAFVYEDGSALYNEYTIPGGSYTANLTAPAFNYTAQSLTLTFDYNAVLTAASFNYSPQSLTVNQNYTATLTAPSFNYTAQDLTLTADWAGTLTAPSFNYTAQDLTLQFNWDGTLTAASFSYTAQDLTVSQMYAATLTAASFNYTAQDLTLQFNWDGVLTAASFNYAAQDMTWLADYNVSLTAASFNYTAQDITVEVITTQILTAPSFNYTAQAISLFSAFSATLTAPSYNYTAQAITWQANYSVVLTGATFGYTAQDLTWQADYAADLTAASFNYTAQDMTWLSDYNVVLTAPTFTYTPQDIDVITNPGQIDLTAADFKYLAQALLVTSAGGAAPTLGGGLVRPGVRGLLRPPVKAVLSDREV